MLTINNILPDDISWKKKWAFYSLLSLVLIVFAAIFSYGFYTPDEYFSIIQFVNFKLGGLPHSQMHWEYHNHIRSWALPFFYYCAAKLLQMIGIKNPFLITFYFRLFSGIIGWFALNALALLSYKWISKTNERIIQLRILFFLYFIPFLLVRTSSENLSGSTFMLSFFHLAYPAASLVKGKMTLRQFCVYFASGILLGLSFEFRYQSGILVAALLAWLFIIVRLPLRYMLIICLGIAVSIITGSLIDRWGYGQWVFPPWDYVRICIFENVQENFGLSPFYAYVTMLIKRPMLPVNILIIIGAFCLWIRYPKHPVTWITLTFFIVHSCIGHKEVRFLFPIALPATLFIIMGLANGFTLTLRIQKLIPSKLCKAFNTLLYSINIAALLFLCFSARQPEIKMQKFIYHNAYPESRWYFCKYNPYALYGQPMTFYRPHSLELDSIEAPQSLERLLPCLTHPAYFICCASYFADSVIINTYNPKLVYAGNPFRHKFLLFISNWFPSSLRGSIESYVSKQKDRSIYLIDPVGKQYE